MTVLSSTFSTPPCDRMPWNDESAAETVSGFSRMSMVARTSSAPNGLPCWKVTPCRSVNVQFLAVASGSHFSARTGRSVRSLLTQIRYSATCWVRAIEPVSYMVVGSSATMGETMPTLSVPPAFGAAVAEAEAAVGSSSPPQAARILPTAVADRPRTVALTIS